MSTPIDNSCPCSSGESFGECSERHLLGKAPAPTALALMRSRYAAYVMQNANYLLDSWHPKTRPKMLELDPKQRWLGLKIKQTIAGTEQDNQGLVEFVARYKIAGRGYRLQEISRFERHHGAWVYIDGVIVDAKSR